MRRAGLAHTILGVAILAVLLFPLYWMLDTSLQPHQAGGVKTPWFPIHPSLHGYTQAIHDQGGHLLTSLMIALGCVASACSLPPLPHMPSPSSTSKGSESSS